MIDVVDCWCHDRAGVRDRRISDARRQLLALNQPSEFLIIGGAALGALLISTPMPVVKQMFGQLAGLFKSGPGKDDYLDLLTMMYEMFRLTQQSGVMALEAHCDDPVGSPILSKYPRFLANHHAVDFFTDSVKVIILGGVGPHDLEALMDDDLEVHHHEAMKPSRTLARISDALPGLGIVAAVLGVVITMQAIDGPPRRSATRSARRWSARSSASSCPTASSVRSPRTSNPRSSAIAVLELHEVGTAGDEQGLRAGHRRGVRAARDSR